MQLIQGYFIQNFSLMLTIAFFAISFFTFIGAMIWLSLLGKNYIKHAERLPHNDEKR